MVCQRELLASWLGLMLRVWWWLYPPSSCVGGWSGLVTFGPSSIGVKVLYWLNATCDACSSVQSKSKRRLLLWLETGHLAPRQRFLQNADRAYLQYQRERKRNVSVDNEWCSCEKFSQTFNGDFAVTNKLKKVHYFAKFTGIVPKEWQNS